MSDQTYERYCLREQATCSCCGTRTMHQRVKNLRLDRYGWMCEECGSVKADPPGTGLFRGPDGKPLQRGDLW